MHGSSWCFQCSNALRWESCGAQLELAPWLARWHWHLPESVKPRWIPDSSPTTPAALVHRPLHKVIIIAIGTRAKSHATCSLDKRVGVSELHQPLLTVRAGGRLDTDHVLCQYHPRAAYAPARARLPLTRTPTASRFLPLVVEALTVTTMIYTTQIARLDGKTSW